MPNNRRTYDASAAATPANSNTPEHETLYDAYLDAILAGQLEAPADFLARHGVRDDAELLAQLRAVHDAAAKNLKHAGEPLDAREMSTASTSFSEPASLIAAACASEAAGLDIADSDDVGDACPRDFGEYRLLKRLGEGGMGVVYLAEQTTLGRHVAVKVMQPEFSRSVTAVKRFEREARAIARLRHPNIVAVHAVGQVQGVRYLAMELAHGCGLDEILLRQSSQLKGANAGTPGAALPVSTVLRWGAQIADALAYAHSQGIVHRDIKPSNIRIVVDEVRTSNGEHRNAMRDGESAPTSRDAISGDFTDSYFDDARNSRAMLVDFGLARDLHADGATLSEAFVGSPFYVAPEQVARGGGNVDGRADVYSLGIVLYQCLTGRMPFSEGNLEQVLHQILTIDPPPLRSVNPSLPRDVEVVIHKAIAKHADDRYESAAAFAADLNALLELRPIAARPPGRLRRLAHWARRRKAVAAATGTALAAILVMSGVLVGQRIHAQMQRARDAQAAVDQAAELLAAYRNSRQETERIEREFEILRQEAGARYLSSQEDQQLNLAEDRIAMLRKQRERDFYQVLDLLARAERLGADAIQVQRVRAEVYLAKYLEAALVMDTAEMTMYRDLVRQNDPDGQLQHALLGGRPVTLTSTPSGAEVHLFRMVELSALDPSGDHRMVPVPVNGSTPEVKPGSWCLRVRRIAENAEETVLREGDLILQLAGHDLRHAVFVLQPTDRLLPGDRLIAIDGQAITQPDEATSLHTQSDSGTAPPVRRFELDRRGDRFVVEATSLDALGAIVGDARALGERGSIDALVWREGGTHQMMLPRGLDLLPTAAPLIVSSASFVGRTPLENVHLEGGDYIVLLRAEGYDDQRVALQVTPGSAASPMRHHVRLNKPGDIPAGFVALFDSLPAPDGSTTEELWIMEREVTVREYFEFLNDPATLAEIDAASAPIRVPRNTVQGVHVTRGPDGKYQLPHEWSWDWPIFGISWHDAQAYAAWKTRRAREAGRNETYELPSLEHWVQAAAACYGCQYVYGGRFRPKWVSSCFARPRAFPIAVMSYPIDESRLGVYDMAGSVSEWLNTFWQAERGTYRHVGGSWAHGAADMFRVYGGNGLPPDLYSDTVGFRLILRRHSELSPNPAHSTTHPPEI